MATVKKADAASTLNMTVDDIDHLVSAGLLELGARNGIELSSLVGYISEKAKADQRLGRRKFIAGSTALVVSAIALPATTNFLGSIGAMLAYKELESPPHPGAAQGYELRKSVFGNIADASWSASADHLISTYGISAFHASSTFNAAKSLYESFDMRSISAFSPTLPGPIFVDTDVLAIGGPLSDPVAFRAFEMVGHRYSQERKNITHLDLPLLYKPSSQQGAGKRFVAGEERTVKNWTLSLDGEDIPPPTISKSGAFESDYLLVTRIPNFLHYDAYIAGRSILVIGGIHGTGTEAIKLLLANESLLAAILHGANGSRYFQSLFLVSDISVTKRNSILVTQPKTISHILTRSLEVDKDRVLKIGF